MGAVPQYPPNCLKPGWPSTIRAPPAASSKAGLAQSLGLWPPWESQAPPADPVRSAALSWEYCPPRKGQHEVAGTALSASWSEPPYLLGDHSEVNGVPKFMCTWQLSVILFGDRLFVIKLGCGHPGLGGPCDRQKSRHRERACDNRGRDGGRGHEPRDTWGPLSGKRQEGLSPRASGRSMGGPADTSLSDSWPPEVRGTVPVGLAPGQWCCVPVRGTGTPSPCHGVHSTSSVQKALEHGQGWLRAPLGADGHTRATPSLLHLSASWGPRGAVSPPPGACRRWLCSDNHGPLLLTARHACLILWTGKLRRGPEVLLSHVQARQSPGPSPAAPDPSGLLVPQWLVSR